MPISYTSDTNSFKVKFKVYLTIFVVFLTHLVYAEGNNPIRPLRRAFLYSPNRFVII